MTSTRLLSALMLLATLAAPAQAAQARASFGVSVVVTYNCAMDMSKLTAEQRKVVDAACKPQTEPNATQPKK